MHMWRRLKVDEEAELSVNVGHVRVRLLSDLRSVVNPALTESQVKAELMLFFHGYDDEVQRLLIATEENRAAKIEAIPRLPKERREVMLEEARRVAAAAIVGLNSLRERLQKAGRLEGLPETLPAMVAAQREARPSDTQAGAMRGRAHEEAALRWARGHWAGEGYKLIESCYPQLEGRGDARRYPDRGLKLEFDGVVLGPGSRLVAVIEAKAGCNLYKDLPKLLEVRKHWLQPGTSLRLQQRHRNGLPAARDTPELVAADQTTHMAYVFGTCSPKDILASAIPVEAGLMLAASCSRRMPPVEMADADGKYASVHVDFDGDIVAACQDRLNSFESLLSELMEAGELSLWASDANVTDSS